MVSDFPPLGLSWALVVLSWALMEPKKGPRKPRRTPGDPQERPSAPDRPARLPKRSPRAQQQSPLEPSKSSFGAGLGSANLSSNKVKLLVVKTNDLNLKIAYDIFSQKTVEFLL